MSDETEHKFRDFVQTEFGTRKGTMGKVAELALAEYLTKKRQEELSQEMISLLKKGFALDGLKND